MSSLIINPIEILGREGKAASDLCKTCIKSRVAKNDGPPDKSTGIPLYRKGDFIVNCRGIPANDKYLPHHDKLIQKLERENDGELSEDQIGDLLSAYDTITWANRYLDWKPRRSPEGIRYQEDILRCSSKRKVLRCGRRLGKSETMIMWALFRMYNYSPKQKRYDPVTGEYVKGFSTIMFVAPYLSQVKDFFSRLREYVYGNPELAAEVESDVSTPFFRMELKSGMKILGFSAGSNGAASLRGQKADFIILDEMDYLDAESIDTIVALLMEHNEMEMIAASTPSGRREYFYDFCMNRMDFKEFYYPSMVNPGWGPRMEAELRGLYRTEIAWKHEIEADFGEAATSVFQYKYLEQALTPYRYQDQKPREGAVYAMGVDWNDQENGTKIRVVEWDHVMNSIRAVDHATVQKAGWTQTFAIEEMVRMNRIWNCAHVYVDNGYGATQIEMLRKLGQEAQFRKDKWAHHDMNFINTKGINFSSKIDVFDPISGLPNKQPMKPYMVETAVRFFERGMIQFPSEDEMLLKQLHGYSIAKVNASGMPVYEAGPAGDHDIDAFMLALLALEVEFGEHTKQTFSSAIAFSGRIGGGSEVMKEEQENNIPATNLAAETAQRPRTPELKKPIPSMSPRGLYFTNQVPGRIYSPDSFRNDGRYGTATRQDTIQQYRNNTRGSRRLF
ncbi:MAG: terminase family protein [Lachnospiraceae bacterium]|nr:terminase family protein [Lachnospiraceae bacterium]